MERIKLAIDKARAGERDSSKPDQARLHTINASALPRASAEPAAEREQAAGDPISVQYSKTALLSLDPVHLERRRVIAHHKTHAAS